MASVHKRTRTKKGKPDTKWVVRFFDQSSTHRQKTFKLKKDADAFLDQVKDEIQSDTHVLPKDTLTVSQVFELYLRHDETRVKDGRIGDSHQYSTKTTLLRHFKPRFGKRLFKDVTPNDLEDFYNELVKTLAPITVRQYIYRFRDVEDFAFRRGYIKKPSVPEALSRLTGISAEPIRVPSMDEIRTLFRTIEDGEMKGFNAKSRPLLRCFVHIAACCGLRYGEIAALKLPMIDFQRNIISVRQSMTEWGKLKAPKTRAGIRDVPMAANVALALRIWIDEYYHPNDDLLLFANKENGRSKGLVTCCSTFHNLHWRPLLKRSGLDQGETSLHFHALRHFAGSWMIANGVPLTDTASLLGHKKFDMTLQVYAHPIIGGNNRQAAFQKMADKLLTLEPTED